jgi:hypothetical protein
MKHIRRLNKGQRHTFLMLAFALMLKMSAIAQTYNGGLRGAITDSGSATVIGASITLTDEATHQVRATTSDSSGAYAFNAVKPSVYTLHVTAGTFSAADRTHIAIDTQDFLTLDIPLTVGSRDGANVLVFRTFDKIHGLAGLPIGYTLAPRSLAEALRKQGVGDAESLGRLNISAASAALSDTAHVRQIRHITASERTKWVSVLDRLALAHTASHANFIFF